MNIFDIWNGLKKKTSVRNGKVYFHEKEVWYCRLGKNIGDEQDGKGDDFLRPIVVIRKFNKNLLLGVPITSNLKKGKFYQKVEFVREKKAMQ